MEIQASRSGARIGPSEEPVLLLEQDRGRWDQLLIRRGIAALGSAGQLCGSPRLCRAVRGSYGQVTKHRFAYPGRPERRSSEQKERCRRSYPCLSTPSSTTICRKRAIGSTRFFFLNLPPPPNTLIFPPRGSLPT